MSQNLPERDLDESEPEYQHPEQESTDAERAQSIKAAFEHSVTQSILDAIEGMHQTLDKMALQVREQAE